MLAAHDAAQQIRQRDDTRRLLLVIHNIHTVDAVLHNARDHSRECVGSGAGDGLGQLLHIARQLMSTNSRRKRQNSRAAEWKRDKVGGTTTYSQCLLWGALQQQVVLDRLQEVREIVGNQTLQAEKAQ